MEISPHTIEFYHKSEHPFIKTLHIDLDLLNFDSITEPDVCFNNGILNRSNEPDDLFLYSVYQVQNGKRRKLFDHNDGRLCRFVLVQGFLDQYRDNPQSLPFVDPHERFSDFSDRRIPIYQELLKIMLMSLNSYDEFILAMQAYENLSGEHVLDTTIHQRRIFTGNIGDWREPLSDQYEYIEKISAQRYYYVGFSERGSERIFMRLNNVRLAYEYVLNHYCRIL